MLLHASNLSIRPLTWQHFRGLLSRFINLDDPIQHDPNWKTADPSGFFERMLAQQITPQRRNLIQKYGLAIGLFRDIGAAEWPIRYSAREDLEHELGAPFEQFMAMGQICYAQRQANWSRRTCLGTFAPMRLAEAFVQGFTCCVPEVWEPFLERVACNRDEFRRVCAQDVYKVRSPLFSQFEFNPLVRFPLIEIESGRYIAVDPDLIVERVTFGTYFDLFERRGLPFAEKFGYVFDCFVGDLLASVVRPGKLWSASAWEQQANQPKPKGKIGDWAYAGSAHTVLFECKSLRPSVELRTYGSDDAIQSLVERIAAALKQVIGHANSINAGCWTIHGLQPASMVCVVVTYGHINTVNGPFVRRRVKQTLAEDGVESPPFVVLSLEDLDSVVRLVELGHELDDVAYTLASEKESFDVLRHYQVELKDCCVSSITLRRGRDFINSILPNTIADDVERAG